MPSPTWTSLLAAAARTNVGPTFTVDATAPNSSIDRFGNWSFTGNLDILALDYATPPTSLAINATVPVVAFAAGTNGVTSWTGLTTITITGTSDYVILSGAETQTRDGGGLLQPGTTGLTQIINGASRNAFYDLSGLDFATVSGLALQGGNGGVGEIAVSDTVLATSAPIGLGPRPWTGIQVLDAVGNAPGGTIDLANFGTLSGLPDSYLLRTAGTTALRAPAGSALLQFLNAEGSASGPAPALADTLSIANGPHNLAVNLRAVVDSQHDLKFSLSGSAGPPAGSTLALWLSDSFLAGNVISSGYDTVTLSIPTHAGSTTRSAAYIGTSFFQVYAGVYTGSVATATFRDDIAGTTFADATDLYIGRTTDSHSNPFSSPVEAIGHDSIQFRGDTSVLNAEGAGMVFLGANDLVTLDGRASGGVVMDVGGTHTGDYPHPSGIAVTGSQTYQNLLQGSSGQIMDPRIEKKGPWANSPVYTSSAVFGDVGSGLLGIGNDVLVAGTGLPQPGSGSAGGDNVFGMGGLDHVTLGTGLRYATTVWIGYYAVGHTGTTAAPGQVYGQAITAVDSVIEHYVNGYGLASQYLAVPVGFGAEGWSTTVDNFQVGAGRDRLNFNPPDWARDGAILGLVDGGLKAIAPGAAIAQKLTSLDREIAASTTLALDGLGVYATASDLVAGLTGTDYLTLSPTHFAKDSTFHMLVAYATATGSGSLHVADLWITNHSVTNPAAGISTKAGLGLIVQAVDLVHLDGQPGSNLDLLGDNVFFPPPPASLSSTGTTAEPAGGTVTGGPGDDTVTAGSARETFALGAGADTVRATLANLAGDTFSDFSTEDRILLVGVALTRGNLVSTDGGLTYTFKGTGGDDVTFSFANGLPGGDLMLAHVGSDTVLTYVSHLPPLADGTPLSGSAINGIVNRSYLNGDTASSFSVRVEAASGAVFHNTLGTYQVDANGRIDDVRILAPDVNGVTSLFTVDGIAAGHQLGFFLVQDGANRLPAAALGGGSLSFQASGRALVLALDGSPVPGVNTFFTHDAGRNIDGAEHVLSGVAPDGSGALRIGFEDLLRGGPSDDDFQDVVVTVTATGWHV